MIGGERNFNAGDRIFVRKLTVLGVELEGDLK
jgi:hypothetical protein